jgi:hypothetical protein
MVLEIPLAKLDLQPALGRASNATTLTVQFLVSDADGTLLTIPQQTIEISIPDTVLDQARSGYWSHRIQMELPEDRVVSVGALLIEKSTGAWATASCEIPAEN